MALRTIDDEALTERHAVRLLFAEDDVMLGRATCVALLQAGHAVDWVTNGNQLLAALGKQDYDCVLLDLGLPGPSGEECLRSLRARQQRVPVVVLTARGQKDDRIAMLDLGADDYMVKPYDLDEMAARVRAVVRRARETEHKSEYTHGPLLVKPSTRTVLWYDQPVVLTGKEYLLLEALVRQPTRIATREDLERALYGWGEEIGSNAVEVHVHHLRRKLSPKLIVTLRGVGYQLGPLDRLNGVPFERK
jgi:two-component system response regulator QseB